MALVHEWARLSARIHGLIRASELHSSLFEKHADAVGAMKNLGGAAGLIVGALEQFQAVLSPSDGELHSKIGTAVASVKPLLDPKSASTPDMRQIHIRSALVALAALEVEVTFLLSDYQADLRNRTERAFEHLQRSIVVDDSLRARWQAAHHAGETECEKLGAVHLLAHGIWAFKAHASGGRTDLVYQEPLQDLRAATRSAEGLVLTEWKKSDTRDATGLFAAARGQAKAYATGVLAGIELAGVRYAVVVSKDILKVPADIIEGGNTYRHINIAVAPPTPSRQKL